jgi:hypothetical protein
LARVSTRCRISALIRGSPRKARETVEEATPSFWAISAIRVVRICCTSILLVSDLATNAADLNPD